MTLSVSPASFTILIGGRPIPPEVLGQIFSYLSACTMISISHVCHHFREVALHCSSLWTRLDFAVPRPRGWPETRMLLDRAKDQLLSLKISDDGSPEADFGSQDLDGEGERLIERALVPFRARSLDLYFSDKRILGVLSLLHEPAEHLVQLELTSANSYKEFIPDTFLAGHAPALEIVCLDRISLRWDSPLWSEMLKHLSLFNTPKETEPSFPELLSLLRKTPRLESLTLGEITFELTLPSFHEDSIPDSNHVVSLPFLRALCFFGMFDRYTNFLTHLILPRDVAIRIEADLYSPEDIGPLFPKSLLEAKCTREVNADSMDTTRQAYYTLSIHARDDSEGDSEGDLIMRDSGKQRETYDISVHPSSYDASDTLSDLDFASIFDSDGYFSMVWVPGEYHCSPDLFYDEVTGYFVPYSCSPRIDAKFTCYFTDVSDRDPSWIPHDYLFSTFLSPACARLDNIDTLKLSVHNDNLSLDWTTLFKSAPRVSRLVVDVDEGDFSAIMDALQPERDSGMSLLPELSQLYLYWNGYDDDGEDDEYIEFLNPSTMVDFVGLLSARKQSSVRSLDRLVIRGADFETQYQEFAGTLEVLLCALNFLEDRDKISENHFPLDPCFDPRLDTLTLDDWLTLAMTLALDPASLRSRGSVRRVSKQLFVFRTQFNWQDITTVSYLLPQAPSNKHTAHYAMSLNSQLTLSNGASVLSYPIPFIMQLPTELLARIFYFCLPDARIRLTWTCRHLRDVALGNCSLWTKFNIHPFDASTFERENTKMARAGDRYPIDLRVSIDHPPSDDTDLDIGYDLLDCALSPESACRYRTLDLWLIATDTAYPLSQLVHAAPLLETLIVNIDYSTVDMDWEEHSQSLSDSFLGNYAPKLRTIMLTACSLNWNSNLFGAALTHLSIQHVSDSEESELIEMLRLLQRTPALKTLRLDGSFYWEEVDAEDHPRPVVSLPHLERLYICNHSFPELFLFVGGLTLPDKVQICFSVMYNCAADSDALLPRSLLEPKLRLGNGQPPNKTLSIYAHAFYNISVHTSTYVDALTEDLSFWSVYDQGTEHGSELCPANTDHSFDDVTGEYIPNTSYPRIDASFPRPEDEGTEHENLLPTLMPLAGAGLENIDTLKLVTSTHPGRAVDWNILLSAMPNLSRLALDVTPSDLISFLNALSPSSVDGEKAVLVPNLKELYLQWCYVESVGQGSQKTISYSPPSNAINALKARAAAGEKLAKFVMCGVQGVSRAFQVFEPELKSTAAVFEWREWAMRVNTESSLD
ncbi:hypothetical protein CONPUDRAFT_73708 [Coniophora puteana RWD-64-598 SS2]|uniref:F-box domain-containing protein n=1 Tax=Coniophora puteana (strain RWD-64-598) TaxID=741705 RepID=A0A5M3MPY4_CONPW|nr:uncharacterized protein CONPUDRAFT_73708 [Coniophora puteana RWD-64-598 SS2]EIW80621.1 hypothetical protein CONPUDRAFT_73708 [Coniophora puteana RWD-64-598 SS2]